MPTKTKIHFDWSLKSIAKILGLTFLGVVVLAIVISLVSFSFKTIFSLNQGPQYAKSMGYGGRADMAMESSMARGGIVPPNGGFSGGVDAEDYEVKNYSGTVRTADLDTTCSVFENLKARKDVIFERANRGKNNCDFGFKVFKGEEDEIVELIQGMDPEHFNANIQSIKRSIEGYESELDILKKKLASIEDTLESAQSAYDQLTELATEKEDVETLAKIIDSKLNLIEKLSRERLSVKERIDRFNVNKQRQLDQLDFVFFNVNVYEDLILDLEQIKESWHQEIKTLVRNVNNSLQDLSVGLISYLLRFLQVLIYLALSMFLLKGAWLGAKVIWKGCRS